MWWVGLRGSKTSEGGERGVGGGREVFQNSRSVSRRRAVEEEGAIVSTRILGPQVSALVY